MSDNSADQRIADLTSALEVVEARVRDAEDFIERRGYRKCDIPACNCPFWHGGHAEARLSEIGESLRDAGINGGTIHGGVLELIRDKESAEARRAEAERLKDERENALELAVDEADLLMARYIEQRLPASVWQQWRRLHRDALCDPPPVIGNAHAKALAAKEAAERQGKGRDGA